MRGRTREGTGGKCAAEPLGQQVSGQGWACARITQDRKMQREGLRKGDGIISRQNTIVQESVQWAPWPGPARRPGE